MFKSLRIFTVEKFPNTQLYADVAGGWFMIGLWNLKGHTWTAIDRASPEVMKLAKLEVDKLNSMADGKHYRLCYNCKGLKTVEVSYGKMRDNNIRKTIDCPTCKAHGTLQKVTVQESLL